LEALWKRSLIVGDKKYGELLGGHIVSVKAADLIQELVNATSSRAATTRWPARSLHIRCSPRRSWRPPGRRTGG
jgi:pyruvate/2-oxoglutarate dehydrogenase complex dihydrolipoamide dehydrogenase (E3) component